MICTYISLHELGQIDVPNFKRHREGEQFDPALIDLEAFFEIFVFFQEGGVVDDDLSVGDPELENLVIHRLGAFDGPNGLFQINIERP